MNRRGFIGGLMAMLGLAYNKDAKQTKDSCNIDWYFNPDNKCVVTISVPDSDLKQVLKNLGVDIIQTGEEMRSSHPNWKYLLFEPRR